MTPSALLILSSPPERHSALLKAYRKVLEKVSDSERLEVIGLLTDLAILTANYSGEAALEQIRKEIEATNDSH